MENNTDEKYILAFVGLPARGKSYLSKKLAKYLNWIGYKSEVFSIGLYRRLFIGTNCDWKYFDDSNIETLAYREKCVNLVLDDLIKFLIEGGKVGIIDGTNTRSSRRRGIEKYLNETFSKLSNIKYHFVWIETIVTIEKVIEKNIIKTKLKSPDYKDWDEAQAVEDFKKRIKVYEKVYENLSLEVDGKDSSYIQIKNRNTEVVIHNVKGFVQSKVLSYLINLNPEDKPIYLTRHGESEHNLRGIIGGDSALSSVGCKYAKELYNFFNNEDSIKVYKCKGRCYIYASTLKRSYQTSQELKNLGKIFTYKCLEELQAGLMDGLTYEEVAEKFPKDYEDRAKDKLNYRYPRGESYRDLINRIEPMIHELERRDGPVIVVGHQATLRCIYGYFANAPLEKIPSLEVPLHCVIKFVPEAYGFNEERFNIDPHTGITTKVDQEKITKFVDNLYHIPEKKII
jgi:6-phosphofructo-2-kinase/fructose-2,6-biphosphatase 2/6-phosphofructo-2-kinase/fructose-2,6-biphosphatase 4